MQTKQILLNWILTTYLTSDDFNPEKCLLFLHGRWNDKMSFLEIYKLLDEKNISYIAIDFPWFWWSGFPNFDWSVYDYAEFIQDFIKRLELVKPTLIWHSFWWRICIILWSAEAYDNIDKIILIWSAWIKPKINKLKLAIVKTWKTIFSIPWLKWVWDKIKQKIWSRDYLNSWRMKNIFLKTINDDLTHLFEKIKYPTLLIRWLLDSETPVADGILMSNTIDNAKLKIYDNWTHFVHQEFPNDVFQDIEKFLQK